MSASGFNEIFGGSLVYPSQLSYLPLALTSDVQLNWPVEQNPGGGNIAADIIDVNAASTGLSIQFSDATQVATGYSALIVNVGANTFSVLDDAGNTLASIASGQAWQLYLRNNTTPQGVWGIFQFGAGVSNANAGALAGAGLQAINSTLNEAVIINEQNTNYTIQASDLATVIEWTGGVGTITSPSPVTVGDNWFCMIKNNGTGDVTFTPASGMIDGASSLVFDLNQSAWIVCDGTNFFTLGYGQAISSIFNFIQISLATVTGDYPLTGAQLNAISYRFTGALAGNTVVRVPSTIQQYWVDNETSGGFTLSFGTVGQATPVEVPTGQKNILYCDGTNVEAAVSGTLTLPVTAVNGGTGQTVYAIGDLLYASTTTALSRLAANAAATRKFLTEISGGIPVWNTLAASDLGSGAASSTSFLRGNQTWSGLAATDLGSGSASAASFLRGDLTWSNTLNGPLTVTGGLFANGGFSASKGANISTSLGSAALSVSGGSSTNAMDVSGGIGLGTFGAGGVIFTGYSLTHPDLGLSAFGTGSIGAAFPSVTNKPGATGGTAGPSQWLSISLNGNAYLIPCWTY